MIVFSWSSITEKGSILRDRSITKITITKNVEYLYHTNHIDRTSYSHSLNSVKMFRMRSAQHLLIAIAGLASAWLQGMSLESSGNDFVYRQWLRPFLITHPITETENTISVILKLKMLSRKFNPYNEHDYRNSIMLSIIWNLNISSSKFEIIIK